MILFIDILQASFGSILMILLGLLAIYFGISTHQEQSLLKKHGEKTKATITGFTKEKGSSQHSTIKVPVLRFNHNNTPYKVKLKSTAKASIGEETTIYFNPKNPEKEYYCPDKEFLMKYVMFLLGSFFFCLGGNYLFKKLEIISKTSFSNMMLILMASLIIVSFFIYCIGLIRYQLKN